MKDYKKQITIVIKKLGISASLLGYQYIRYAVELMVKEPKLINCKITQIIYPAVAKEFNTTISRAERGIRHAIESGWMRADEDTERQIFGNCVSPLSGKPTNSEFLANVADYILTYDDSETGGDA